MKIAAFALLSILPFAVMSQGLVETIVENESFTIYLTGANGTIKWYTSTDSVVWNEITGATSSTYTSTMAASVTGKRYYRATITNASVCANSPWHSSVVSYRIVSSASLVVKGDWFRGGRVFNTDGIGNGKIVPVYDNLSLRPWGCDGTSIPSAQSMTNGAANTTAIVANCSQTPIAAKVCNDTTINGYTDWYLPAKVELDSLYRNRTITGNFSSSGYWSSTEISSDLASTQQMSSGSFINQAKYLSTRSRCIRSYTSVGSTISYSYATDPVPAGIATQPLASQTYCGGATATFSVTTSGTSPFTYQWKKNSSNISGATASTYNLSNVSTASEGSYTVVVTNMCSSITSTASQLKVIQLNVNAGADVQLCSYAPVQITATASSSYPADSDPLSYQWSPATGLSATNISNPIADTPTNMTYTLTVTDIGGCTKTDNISITYPVTLAATSQPVSQLKSVGESVSFTFGVSGTNPLYQWKKNGVNIPGATAATYTISSIRYADQNTQYSCTASNFCSSVSSDTATLTVFSGHAETLISTDSIQLTLIGNPGDIQWQESQDSAVWTDIPGATTNVYQHKTPVTPTGKLYYRAKISNPAVCELSPWYSTVIRYLVINSTTALQVGNYFKGGIVYYVSGGTGLIANEQDQSAGVAWGCASGSHSATSTLDGQTNTTNIVNFCPTRPIAASICDSLTSMNYSDWFLPAQIQLEYLCNEKSLVGRFENVNYWSSTEWSGSNARAFNFSSCSVTNMSRISLARARCVRKAETTAKTYSIAYPLEAPVSVSITSDPSAQIICSGEDVSFSITATGDMPVTYQWKKDGADISGATSAQITITGATVADEGMYTCVATNLCKSIESSTAELKVVDPQLTINGGGHFCTNADKRLEAIAVSNHPAESGTFAYNWATGTGDGQLLETGIYNPLVTATIPSDFSVTITDDLGCTVTDIVSVIPDFPVSISQYISDQLLCAGDNFNASVTLTGTAPFVVHWINGNDTLDSDTTAAVSAAYFSAVVSPANEGNYYTIADNVCGSYVSDTIPLIVVEIQSQVNTVQPICFGATSFIVPSIVSNHPGLSVPYSYEWQNANASFTSLNDTLIFTPDSGMNSQISYTITDNNGCLSSGSFYIPVFYTFQNEEICLVSVDTLAWKNKVMWEGTAGVGTEKFRIYKESTFNVYDLIGEVPYGSQTFYVDAGSNPESHSDRYKISVVDTCGSESELSYYHNTMNLIVSVFGSTMGLSWTQYATEDGSYTPSSYYIYKGPTPTSMQLLTTVSGSQNTYNDVNVFDLQFYMIGAERGCNTYPTFSNKRDNGIVANETKYLPGTMLISPNPMSSSATLSIPNFSNQLSVISDQITVTDITGKVVRTIPLTPSRHPELVSGSTNAQLTIERGDLKPGIYFVEVKADRIYRGKMVVE
jgi:hypothetical protein